MSTKISENMNAQGMEPYEVKSREGGNNTRGQLEQVRPTGIVATGGKRKLSMEERNSGRSQSRERSR